MLRKEFIRHMNLAIFHQKNYETSGSPYSCINLHTAFSTSIVYGFSIPICNLELLKSEYEAMFKLHNGVFWLEIYDTCNDLLNQERIGMLQMFRQVALDGRLYERY